MVPWLLAVPFAGGVASVAIRRPEWNRFLLVFVGILQAALTAAAWVLPREIPGEWVGLDDLGLLFLTAVTGLFLPVSIYTVGYLARGRKHIPATESLFITCMLFFLGTMTWVTVAQQFEVLWVAIEATTLASAPLIYFHHSRHSVEATWKYLIICSVGIALALLGTVFLAVSASFSDVEGLQIGNMVAQAHALQPTYLRLAFVLFVVGYGTKMGLAPLHAWLPDAHSEAPSPVSAMLSGASLACAFLGILRLVQVCEAAGQMELVRNVMTGFGVVSLSVAALYLVRQRDFKRLLAYSSVEHMGLAALGIGLGGSAVNASLLHVVGHAWVKGMAFLVAGNLLSAYHSKRVDHVTGAIRLVPATGVLWLVALFLVTGAPPSALFVSELGLLRAMVDGGQWGLALLVLGLLSVAFVGLAAAMVPMALGEKPVLKIKEGDDGRERTDNVWVILPLVMLVCGACVVGPLHARTLLRGLETCGIVVGRQSMNHKPFVWTGNGLALTFDEIPSVPLEEWREAILEEMKSRERVICLTALNASGKLKDGPTDMLVIVARDSGGCLGLLRTPAVKSYVSLTPACPQVHLFEREMYETWGILPEGHPWLKPVRYPKQRMDGKPLADSSPAGVMEPYRVEGEEVHEVAVGPVHAGVIEPGHFRFQCHGEWVSHLEIALGFQHRGIERALVGGPNLRTAHYMETLAGDTSIGHMTAYAQVVESLSGVEPPAKANVIRALALELERSANHVGDIGALAGDVGFLPTQSFCGRLRGDYLNLSALLCGNRFGRGLVRPGGVQFDVDADLAATLLQRLDAVFSDVKGASELLFETPSVRARFEGTGTVSKHDSTEWGLVGVAARGCGRTRDVRWDFPMGAWTSTRGAASVRTTGDVMARAYVRWMELQHSHEWMTGWLKKLPDSPVSLPVGPMKAGKIVVSLVEGWRGEVVHIAVTDAGGQFAAYKVVDPSFHNWSGLALALRNGEISDFPLCNKSFNLSYCGFDL